MISRVLFLRFLLLTIISCQVLLLLLYYTIKNRNEIMDNDDNSNNYYNLKINNNLKIDDNNLKINNYKNMNNITGEKSSVSLEEIVFIERKQKLNEMCRLYYYKNKRDFLILKNKRRDLDHILVDEKHRLLYCYVPKVACTNWKRVFAVLTGKFDNDNDNDNIINNNNNDLSSIIPARLVHRKDMFRRLSDYSLERINFFVNNFTKYLFVRHPFERLVSAYRNKLENRSINSKYFQLRIGTEIARKYRLNASERSIKYGDDVTFDEFVTYLTERQPDDYNEHWKPIDRLCYPCYVDYDLIGKYETLYDDSEFILNYVANEPSIKFPRRVKLSDTSIRARQYLRSIIDNNLISRLYNIFILDFKLFDYQLADVLGYDIG